MTTIHSDIVIIGSGFTGSLLSLMADKLGLSVTLIEKSSHPRFSLGESSTPLADMVLKNLTEKYELESIAPFCKYGTWKKKYPRIACGQKRGFSFFHHQAGEKFNPGFTNSNALLVEASPSEELSDTHWFREEFDHFLVQEVQKTSVNYFDYTDIVQLDNNNSNNNGWTLRAVQNNEVHLIVHAGYLINASSGFDLLNEKCQIYDTTDALLTDSSCIYSHFENITEWEKVYREAGFDSSQFPFPPDRAALHHYFEAGWMYQLPFDNGITSCGFVIANHNLSNHNKFDEKEYWGILLRNFPAIQKQFQMAEPIRKISYINRIQRMSSTFSGTNWISLPFAGGFIDPLFSTGIAHSLICVKRIADIFECIANEQNPCSLLDKYNQSVINEFALLDKIISGSYGAMKYPEIFNTYSMIYFALTIYIEHHLACGIDLLNDKGFLQANDVSVQRVVDDSIEMLNDVMSDIAKNVEDESAFSKYVQSFQRQIQSLIEPVNLAGMCDPAKNNMYNYEELPPVSTC